MKRLFSGIILVLVIISCNNQKQVKIKGKFSNGKEVKLVFEKQDVYFSQKIDSVILKSGGKFSFVSELRSPEFFAIKLDSSRIVPLLLEPGEKVNITANLSDYPASLAIKGSKGSELLAELNYELYKTQKKLDSLTVIFNNEDAEEKERILKEYQMVLDSHRKYSLGFILKNMNSLVSYTALYQQYKDGYFIFNKVKDLQYFKLVTDSLSKKYSRSKHVIALKENTNSMLREYANKKILSMVTDENYHLPDISLPNLKNDTVKLSSFKGKYILLSFWASWVKESLDYNLKLNEIYKKYKNKGFEIYSVSLDNSRENWSKIIKFDELQWINVIDTKYPNSLSMMTYNVQSLPANYLIGKDFETLIGKNYTPDMLDSKLQELLK